jgi:3-oxoacyl-(acyl-carrier-protein) synthase
MKNEVFIVGYESISPLGLSVKQQFENLLKQKKGYSTFKEIEGVRLHGELVNIKNFLDERLSNSLRKIGSQGILHNYLLYVANNLNFKFEVNPERIGVFVGISSGDHELMEGISNVRFDNGAHLCLNSLSSVLSRKYNLQGESNSVSQGCSSGIAAITQACRAIELRELDVAIVAGVDAPYKIFNINSLSGDALSKENTLNPFDLKRDGTVPSGGCGILILMSEPKARKYEKYAKIIGYSSVNKSSLLENPSTGIIRDGYISSMKNSLKMAKISKPSFIVAHATGTISNDPVEAEAISEVLSKTPVCCLKKFTGHTMSASSIIEISLCLEAMKKGILPGMGKIDFEKGKEVLVNENNRKMKINSFILNSAGFNGAYGSVIIKAV